MPTQTEGKSQKTLTTECHHHTSPLSAQTKVKRYSALSLLLAGIFIAGAWAQTPARFTNDFEVTQVNISDSAAKSQIIVKSVIKHPVTPQQVRDYLQAIYADKHSFDVTMQVDRIKKQEGLRELEREYGVAIDRFHFAQEIKNTSTRNEATHFSAMVYLNKEESASLGNWVGMLQWQAREGKPEIQVHDARLADTATPGGKKFGLTHAERMTVFKERVAGDHRGMEEAERRYPTDLKRQMDLTSTLQDKYKSKLAAKYHLTLSQLNEIADEGTDKNWPLR